MLNKDELSKLTVDELKMIKYELIGNLNKLKEQVGSLKKITRVIDKLIKTKLKT